MLQPGAARDSMRMPSASFSSFQPSSAIADAATPATSSANGRLSSARRRMSDLAGRQTHDQTVERSEEHTSELQSLMRISYAVFCFKKQNKNHINKTDK